MPWRRERLPTPVFWSGEFQELYSPWGRKESDMTERLSLSLFFPYATLDSAVSDILDFFKLGRKIWSVLFCLYLLSFCIPPQSLPLAGKFTKITLPLTLIPIRWGGSELCPRCDGEAELIFASVFGNSLACWPSCPTHAHKNLLPNFISHLGFCSAILSPLFSGINLKQHFLTSVGTLPRVRGLKKWIAMDFVTNGLKSKCLVSSPLSFPNDEQQFPVVPFRKDSDHSQAKQK